MKYTAYIGSYGKKGENGIAIIEFDGKTVSVKACSDRIENPSYLFVNGSYIYAVSEVSKDIGSELVILDKNSLNIVSTMHTTEGGACHVFVSDALNNAYVSNYDTGTTTVFPLKDGLPSGGYKTYKNKGKNPDNPRQTTPHAHFLCQTSSPYRLMSLDLSADKAFIFNSSPAPDSRMIFISHCKFPKGTGPRHAVFKDNTAYILTELSNEIYICDYHTGSGSLWAKSKISTLPQSFDKPSTAAAIKLSPDGEYLFASNRGHDSIASFKIVGNKLSLVGIYPCGGEHPRDIAITHDGKYLLSANTYSNNITVFDIKAGVLTQICDFKGFVSPSCIIFD